MKRLKKNFRAAALTVESMRCTVCNCNCGITDGVVSIAVTVYNGEASVQNGVNSICGGDPINW